MKKVPPFLSHLLLREFKHQGRFLFKYDVRPRSVDIFGIFSRSVERNSYLFTSTIFTSPDTFRLKQTPLKANSIKIKLH